MPIDHRWILRTLGVSALFAAGGCATSDVSQDKELYDRVIECLPPGTPPPAIVSRAIWYPGAHGYTPDPSGIRGHGTGVLAFSGGMLWFMQWNEAERHFDMSQSASVVDAANVYLDRMGTSVVLVIQSRKLNYDSFELMGRGEIRSDPERTHVLFEQIQRMRPPS